MMNPLQAMIASRGANQMPGAGIQSQGAAPAVNPMQYAQMNTAMQPQMMNAPAANLQQMDKYKYVDSALNRGQRNKELIFNTLNAADQRAHQTASAADQRAHQTALEQQRHGNALSAHKYQQEAILEREKQTIQFQQEQAKLLQQMTDDRYAPLREQTAVVLDDYNRWVGGEQEATRERLFTNRVQELALSSIPYEEIEKLYKDNPNYQGKAAPTPFSQEHIDLSINMLKSSPDGQKQVSEILTMVDREVLQIGQQKVTAFRSSMDQLSKLGFSVPEAPEPLTTDSPSNGIRTLPNPSFIPSYILDDQGDGSKKSVNSPLVTERGNRVGKGNNYNVMSPVRFGSDPRANAVPTFPKKDSKKKSDKRPSRRTG
jgi:hypothetical protein